VGLFGKARLSISHEERFGLKSLVTAKPSKYLNKFPKSRKKLRHLDPAEKFNIFSQVILLTCDSGLR